jgi:hypothetical protein
MVRWLHAVAAAVFAAAIVVQVFLAGQAIANLGGSGDFATHAEFGYTWVGLAALALVITALVARRPRRVVGYAVGLLILYIVQTLLPAAKESIPAVAALHPVNAFVLLGLLGYLASRLWRGDRDAARVSQTAV